jgi:hypothetical protein
VNQVATAMLRVSPQLSVFAWLCRLWFAAASVCGIVDAGDRTGTPAIVLAPAKTPQACFEVRGLPSDVAAQLRKVVPNDPRWPQIFSIRVAAAAMGDQPPMLGSYEPTGDGVRFRPRFPLERGMEYRAVFDWRGGDGSPSSAAAPGSHFRLAETFVVPVARGGPPAQVVAIYPSGRELPENLLRLYVQFSAPMSQGNCYRRVHLRDETAGTEVERPFLELPQELWSPDGTRLTLLLEPGRVKHGLVPREELGPILVCGRTYSLTIDESWPDAEGRPLGTGARKAFRSVKSDSRQLDPNSWKIQTPTVGTRGPLSVHFPTPLDRAMLERVLRVLRSDAADRSTAGSAEIAGKSRITEEETRWTFEPRGPWSAGRYVLAVSTRLEDPAGNSIGRPFEVDLKRSPHLPPTSAVVRIPFFVRERP